jgi:hypothetical protein
MNRKKKLHKKGGSEKNKKGIYKVNKIKDNHPVVVPEVVKHQK